MTWNPAPLKDAFAGSSGADCRDCGQPKFFGFIPSEAKNLSVHWAESEERFFASLRMTPEIGFFRSV
jgi:hypothetical protein